MLTDVCQRWRDGKERYRPAGEVINTSLFEVAEILGDKEAKEFVVRNHYSHSFPSARFRFGMYKQGELVGAAVFSHPCSDKVLSCLPGDPLESVELGRFVLLDHVESNGETWFLARCFKLLKAKGITGVLSFSDPMPRARWDVGTGKVLSVVHQGHIGTIYQASSAVFAQRSTPRTLKILPDGTVFSDRAISKIRGMERGWKYSAGILQQFGADPLKEGQDSTEWLRTWMPRLTRNMRHQGNFRYLFGLTRQVRKHLPSSGPYPKVKDRFIMATAGCQQGIINWGLQEAA